MIKNGMHKGLGLVGWLPDREPTPEDFSALVPQPTMEGVLKPTDEFTDEPMQDASMAL